MVTVFCPGHITCFFRPAGDAGEDVLSRGSVGAGIRTSLGSTVDVSERSDEIVRIFLDGVESKAEVTRSVLEQLGIDRGFDIYVDNQLPCGEGFGMSASGAIGVALCLSDIYGFSRQKAFELAHCAEIYGGGGLGDVSALYCLAHQPVRLKPGLPPRGTVVGTDVRIGRMSLAVLGPKMHTGKVLDHEISRNKIVSAGATAVSEFMSAPSLESLYSISNVFSKNADIECPSVTDALIALHRRGYHAAMCMLGNSIFSDAPIDELSSIVGSGASVFSCSSTDEAPCFIHKG